MTPYHVDPLVTLYLGDCIEVMRELPDASVDSVVTDPPYGLEFMSKEWDKLGSVIERTMDTTWDDRPAGSSTPFGGGGNRVRYGTSAKSMQAWHEAWATEAFRVLKPGGYLLAFGGTRTYHRLASAIEDAGFEIRDTLMWIYASGFPKSLDVSKALDKVAGAEREVVGVSPHTANRTAGAIWGGTGAEPERHVTAPATDLARKWEGWGTALKPAHEPIVLARKPLVGTVAANVSRYGTGALNIDGTRIGTTDALHTSTVKTDFRGGNFGNGHRAAEPGDVKEFEQNPAGRWPSNVLLDRSKWEWYTLRDDNPREANDAIIAYYSSLETLPALRGRHTRDAFTVSRSEVLLADVRGSVTEDGSEEGVGDDLLPSMRQGVRGDAGLDPEWSQEVLLPEMLGPVGASGPEAGGAPHGRVAGEDVVGASGDANGTAGERLEGRPMDLTGGIRSRRNQRTPRGSTGASARDGAEQAVHPRTPTDSSGEGGTPVDPSRSGASPEWREAGQPAGESSPARPAEPQPVASDDRPGVAATPRTGEGTGSGERRLEVPLYLIPNGWLPYFRYCHTQEHGPELFDEPNPYVVGSGATPHNQDPETRMHGQKSPVMGATPFSTGREAIAYEDGATGYSRFFRVPSPKGRGPTEGAPPNFGRAADEPPNSDRFASADSLADHPTAFIIPKADRAERERGLAGLPKQQLKTMGDGAGEWSKHGPDNPGLQRANVHPTVKPIDLMRHLVRLVTPPGGVTLDPFAGSGTTGLAASEEGFRAILIEREPEYAEIIVGRLMATPMGLGLDVPAGTKRRAIGEGTYTPGVPYSQNAVYGRLKPTVIKGPPLTESTARVTYVDDESDKEPAA